MKNILTLLFCLCIIFSSLGFAGSTEQQTAKTEFSFVGSKTITKNEFPNIFRPIGNWFKRVFGRKYKNDHYPPNEPPIIESMTLSFSEITKECSKQQAVQNKSCLDVIKKIAVYTIAKDDENDVLTYHYQVSGGDIIGRDSKVVWDLSDVKPGVYTITVGVDDGAGFEGRTVTKEVKVIECPNCN